MIDRSKMRRAPIKSCERVTHNVIAGSDDDLVASQQLPQALLLDLRAVGRHADALHRIRGGAEARVSPRVVEEAYEALRRRHARYEAVLGEDLRPQHTRGGRR